MKSFLCSGVVQFSFQVYLCRYNPSGQKFALKVIPKDAKLSGQRKKFAFSELKIMKVKINHYKLLMIHKTLKNEVAF